MQTTANILAGGFYSVPEVARLLQMDGTRRVRYWLDDAGNGEPLIARDHAKVNGVQAVSFWDMMEIRFIEHFRKQNVSLQTLRKVVINARIEMKAKHPLALANTRFMTDRREVFLQSADQTGDQFTLNLVQNQFEIYVAIENILAKGVSFNAASGLAQSWQPFGAEFPNVIINPLLAFGKPVIGGKALPISTLFAAWKAEKGDGARVASRFGIDSSTVSEAVEFELRLAA